MKIYSYYWKANQEEKVVLSKMLDAAFPELEKEYIELSIDSRVNSILNNSIALCFGTRAFNLVSSVINFAIELPQLSYLINSPENKSFREQTWNALQLINTKDKPNLESNILDLNKKDIVKILDKTNTTLIKELVANKTLYWLATLPGNKKLLITNSDKTINNISFDFKITFEELLAAKLAVELLNIESINIMRGTKDD